MKKITSLAISLLFVLGVTVTGWAQQDAGQQQQDQQKGMPPQADPQVSENMITADKLVGRKIVSQQGEELGQIEDVFINRENGEIGHLVVSSGGVMGMGGDYKIVPWDQVTPQPDQDQVQLDADQQQFDQAPVLSSDEFDQSGGFDYQWMQESYQHYNYEPDWFQQMQQQQDQPGGQPGGQPDQQQMQQPGQEQQPGQGL